MKLRVIKDIVANHGAAIAIILFESILRLYHLYAYTMFLGDQGRDAIITRDIITGTKFTLIGPITSLGGVFLGPFYYYIVAPFLALWHYNPVGLAYGVALMSIALTVWIYAILQKDFGKTTALFTLFFIVTSAHLLDLARFTWNPNLLPYTSFLFLYYIYKTLRDRHLSDALLAGILLSISVQLHYLAYFLVIPAGIYWLTSQGLRKNYVKHIIMIFGSFLLLLSPLFLFDIRHDFLNTKNLLKALADQGHSTSTYAANLQYVFEKAIEVVFFPFQPISLPLVITIVVLLGGVYLLFLLKKSKTPTATFAFLLLLNGICFILLFSKVDSLRVPHYYGPIFLSIYTLLGMLFSAEDTKRFEKNAFLRKRNSMLSMLICIVFFAFQYPYYYFHKSPNYLIREAQDVASSITAKSTEPSFVLASLPPTNDNAQFRYFIERMHKTIITGNQKELYYNAKELFVICHNDEICKPIGDPRWEIAAFAPTRITDEWKLYSYTIFRLVR